MMKKIFALVSALTLIACNSSDILRKGEWTKDTALFELSGPVKQVSYMTGYTSGWREDAQTESFLFSKKGALLPSLLTEQGDTISLKLKRRFGWMQSITSENGEIDFIWSKKHITALSVAGQRIEYRYSESRLKKVIFCGKEYDVDLLVPDKMGNWIVRILKDSHGESVRHERYITYWDEKPSFSFDEDVEIEYITPKYMYLNSPRLENKVLMAANREVFEALKQRDSAEGEVFCKKDYIIRRGAMTGNEENERYMLFYDTRIDRMSVVLYREGKPEFYSQEEEFPFEKLRKSGFEF